VRSLLLVELAVTPLCLWVFALLAAPRAGPAGATTTLRRALRWATADPRGRRGVALLALVLGLNLLECVFDPAVTRALGYDLTGLVQKLEDGFVARFQQGVFAVLPAWTTLPMAGFYLGGFIAALLLPLCLYVAHGNEAARRAWIATFVASYALALPFYLFVPVSEVGWTASSGARPLLETALPGLTAALRSGSALDNCMPSLHVSCTVAAWWTARRFGPPGFARVAGVLVAATAFCVLALGVHWLADVVAGVPYGILCARVGARFQAATPRASAQPGARST